MSDVLVATGCPVAACLFRTKRWNHRKADFDVVVPISPSRNYTPSTASKDHPSDPTCGRLICLSHPYISDRTAPRVCHRRFANRRFVGIPSALAPESAREGSELPESVRPSALAFGDIPI